MVRDGGGPSSKALVSHLFKLPGGNPVAMRQFESLSIPSSRLEPHTLASSKNQNNLPRPQQRT
jgi:hypothetical protein